VQPDDHVIVLFGAIGDLAKRKLLPGLFHLHCARMMPADYRIIATAPDDSMGERRFRSDVHHVLADFARPSVADHLSDQSVIDDAQALRPAA
jgi:glucose-6-phosphate 1-dehydrogenase